MLMRLARQVQKIQTARRRGGKLQDRPKPTANGKAKSEPKKRTRSIEDLEDNLPLALRRRTEAVGSGKKWSPIDIKDESDKGVKVPSPASFPLLVRMG
jgi:hypothetical protein